MNASVVVGADGIARCAWSVGSEDYRRYHDDEWGMPVHGDVALFERLTLEAFQSGLSWLTILRKRENFRAAFAGFDPHAVAAFDDADRARLLADAGIVRNRAKVEAAIGNARALLRLWEAEGPDALDRLVWSAVQPDRARPGSLAEVPATSPTSVALARRLKAAGFTFLGPTTLYAALQAVGVVDDHVRGCHRAAAG